MEDKLLEALEADYKIMCVETKSEFSEDKFNAYLDRVFEAQCDIFMEVQNDSSI